MTREAIATIAALIWLAFASAVLAEEGGGRNAIGERGVLESDGLDRSYLLYPPSEATGPVPLLLALHGRGGSAEMFAEMSGLVGAAAGEAVVVFPQGIGSEWNYLTGVGGNQGVDDVEFLLRLVEKVAGSYPVDRERLFVAGFSNGGFMAQRLACEPDSGIRAFAVVAAAGFGGMASICLRSQPLSVLLLHGSADRVVPWRGQSVVLAGRELLLSASLPETYGFWAARAGCDRVERLDLATANAAAGLEVQGLAASGCRGGHRVVLYALIGGEHVWPGAADDPHAVLGASETIWQFLIDTPTAGDTGADRPAERR